MPTDANRQKQTPQDTERSCLSMSGRVPRHLLACHDPLRCLGVSGGCLWGVWRVSEGYLSGIYGIWRRSDVVGGYVGSQSLQYGAKTLFRHSPVRHNFCHLTILRHWNIKMAAYKLSKNGWVMPFLVIFSLARKKLLVTVAFDHPVVKAWWKICPRKCIELIEWYQRQHSDLLCRYSFRLDDPGN